MEIDFSSLPSPTPDISVLGDLNFPSKDVEWRTNDNGDIHATIHPHLDSSDLGGPKVRVQAEQLFELLNENDMIQVIGKPTRKNKILDLMFTNNSELVHHVTTKSWESFTDHNIVTITVNYSNEAGELHEVDEADDAIQRDLSIPERYSNLYFKDDPWKEVDSELLKVDLTPMSELLPDDSLIWMHEKILNILEDMVPQRKKHSIKNKRKSVPFHRRQLFKRLGKLK